jgi:hypothetical protein
MKRLLIVTSLLLAAWIGLHLTLRPGDVDAANPARGKATADVTIKVHVEEFSEWSDASPVIFETDWSGPLNKMNQKQTISKQLILYSNTNATISARPALNGGILTMGSSTLDTSYRITGAVASPDLRFKSAGEFFAGSNTYTVSHVDGTGAYIINLEVQASSRTSAAPEHGLYTCGVTLTANW